MKLVLSDVKIVIAPQPNGLIGYASLVLNDLLFLGSIGIWKSTDDVGYRITYPTKGSKDIEIFHPLERDFHQEILNTVARRIKEIL